MMNIGFMSETKPQAIFIGYQLGLEWPFALFNIEWDGNELQGSTVNEKTVRRLGIRDIRNKAGRSLQAIPTYKDWMEGII